MTEYPESEKLSAGHGEAMVIADFLEWLQDQHIHLAEQPATGGFRDAGYLVPTLRRPDDLIMDYLGVDQVALETERRHMLATIQRGTLGQDS